MQIKKISESVEEIQLIQASRLVHTSYQVS